jgi:hypothetical protein
VSQNSRRVGTLATTLALGAFGGILPVWAKGTTRLAAASMVGCRLLGKAAEGNVRAWGDSTRTE